MVLEKRMSYVNEIDLAKAVMLLEASCQAYVAFEQDLRFDCGG